MDPEDESESPSLKWIHQIREADYENTKHLPLESWLTSRDPEEVARSCRSLGLRVRIVKSQAENAADRKN